MDYTTPKIAWIQAYDGGVVSKDHEIVLDELISRCVQVRKVDSVPSAVTRDDLCVGDFAFCKQALSKLGVAIPVACDYPECLSYLLYRRVWRSTLGEVGGLLLDGGKAIFIKPAVDLKAFSGLIATTDWISFLISEHSPQLPVLCSEVIKIAAEYRVYIVNAEIRACCRYMGEEKLDKTVVDAAVTELFTSSEGRGISAGCSLDFGVFILDGGTTVTGLIEVNEGFALGLYDGLSRKDYTDLLISRWRSIVLMD